MVYTLHKIRAILSVGFFSHYYLSENVVRNKSQIKIIRIKTDETAFDLIKY